MPYVPSGAIPTISEINEMIQLPDGRKIRKWIYDPCIGWQVWRD